MTKTKVLFISHSQQIGGAEVCLRTLIKFIDREKFEPVVIFPTKAAPGPLRKQIDDLGIQTLDTPLEWWIRRPADRLFHEMPLAKRVGRLQGIIEEIKPDLVYTNTSVICEGAFAAKLAGVPHIWHVPEQLDGHPTLHSLFPLSHVYEIMDATSQHVAVVSNKLRALLETSFAPGKVLTNWLGIDSSVMNAAQFTPIREELKIPSNAMLCISVGGLLPEKGFDLLVEAAVYLKQMGAQAHLLIVGSGQPTAMEVLNGQIASANVEDIVHYLGYRREVPELIKTAELFVLPSRSDAFPLTILESMAAGTAVLATDCGGPKEMLDEGKAGILVPTGDPKALANEILRLSEQPDIRAHFAAVAKQRFQENFRAEAYAKRTEQLFAEALAEAKPQENLSENQLVLDTMTQYQTLYDKVLADGAAQSPIGWHVRRIRRRVGRAVLDWKHRSQR